jgi:hypothetical protein
VVYIVFICTRKNDFRYVFFRIIFFFFEMVNYILLKTICNDLCVMVITTIWFQIYSMNCSCHCLHVRGSWCGQLTTMTTRSPPEVVKQNWPICFKLLGYMLISEWLNSWTMLSPPRSCGHWWISEGGGVQQVLTLHMMKIRRHLVIFLSASSFADSVL